MDALGVVASNLGLELVRGQTAFKWYGSGIDGYQVDTAAYENGIDPKDYGICNHAIRIANNDAAYEVGVVKMPNGSYKLVWDFFNGGFGLSELIGEKGEKLIQLYVKEVAVKNLVKKGMRLSKVERLHGGKLKITMRG